MFITLVQFFCTFENQKKIREKHILYNDLSTCHSWATNLGLTFINQTKKGNADKQTIGLMKLKTDQLVRRTKIILSIKMRQEFFWGFLSMRTLCYNNNILRGVFSLIATGSQLIWFLFFLLMKFPPVICFRIIGLLSFEKSWLNTVSLNSNFS